MIPLDDISRQLSRTTNNKPTNFKTSTAKYWTCIAMCKTVNVYYVINVLGTVTNTIWFD